jgi:hypothetical protein
MVSTMVIRMTRDRFKAALPAVVVLSSPAWNECRGNSGTRGEARGGGNTDSCDGVMDEMTLMLF